MSTPYLYLDFSPVFLTNSVTASLFSAFLESEFNHENILFWRAVDNFKQLADHDQIPTVAREIFDKFIASESEYAVNLGFTVVQALNDKICVLLSRIDQCRLQETSEKQELEGLFDSLSSMFDEAQENIFQLMKMDPYPRFLKSESYSKLICFRPHAQDMGVTGGGHENGVDVTGTNRPHMHTIHTMHPGLHTIHPGLHAIHPGLHTMHTLSGEVHPLGSVVLTGLLADAERQDGWKELHEQDGVIVSWKKTGDIYSTRGIGIVDADPCDVFQLVHDMRKRRLWDDFLVEVHEVERLDNLLTVYYMSCRGSPEKQLLSKDTQAADVDTSAQGSSTLSAQPTDIPRDFVVVRATHASKDDGSFVSAVKSVFHPGIPIREGFVRGEMDSSGFIIRPCGPNQSLVIYLAQVDPRGKLSKQSEDHFLQQRPLCILQLRQLARKLKQGDCDPIDQWHTANPFASKPRKKWNRASVYVPNTRIFNTNNMNVWNGVSPPLFDYTVYIPSDTPKISNNGAHHPELHNTTEPISNHIPTTNSKSAPPETTPSGPFSQSQSALPAFLSNQEPSATEFKLNHSPILNPNRPELSGTPDGADTKTITRRIIGTPPASPITSRRANAQFIIGTPPDSPSKSKANQFVIGTPPDSPTKERLMLSNSSGRSEAKSKIQLAFATDSASEAKGNGKPNPSTPPDNSTTKSKSASRLNTQTPPDSPSSIKSKSASRINLSASSSPYSSDGEHSDFDEPITKRKGSKLNLFVGKLTNSSPSSNSDDEKPSIWHRAANYFAPKQVESE